VDWQDATQSRGARASEEGPAWGWPLEIPASQAGGAGQRGVTRWVWGLVALGIAARLVRYALNVPLGSDEAHLAANLIDKGFLDLLGPLNYEQVCPLLFLWGQLACTKVFGFHEYSLRLLPLVFGVASVLLFRHVAGRVFRGTAWALAVGIFAVAYAGIRYSAEAKPYEADLLVALVLLGVAIEWLRCPGRSARLWALVAIVPVAIGLSYPAVFVAGGISLGVAYVLWRRGLVRLWPVWIVYNLVLLESFLALFALSTANQCSGCLREMRLFWRDAFPPLGEPGKLAAWLLSVHTGAFLAHPVGGLHGGSTLTFLACVIAVVVLLRRRQAALAVVLLAPLAVHFVAAALQRYPYGGHVRLAMYFAPACCLLAGLGTSAALAWLSEALWRVSPLPVGEGWGVGGRRDCANKETVLPRNRPHPNPLPKGEGTATTRFFGRLSACRSYRPGLVAAVFGLLAMVAVGSIARDLWRPCRASEDVWARDFARRFWTTSESQGEVACLKTDLGQDFSPDNFHLRFSAIYRCNQRIYSPRHARGEPVRWERICSAWPLRCVEYKAPLFRYEKQAFDAWLEHMRSRYELVSRETFPMHMGRTSGNPEDDYVEVYEFIPRAELAGRNATAAGEVK